MSFPSITNRGEFFSNHYLDAVIGADLRDLQKAWQQAENRGERSARAGVRNAGAGFFAARAAASEAGPSTGLNRLQRLNDVVLSALGFTPSRQERDFKRNTTDLLTIPVAASVETSSGLLLVAIEAGLADSADDLFDVGPDGDPQVRMPGTGRRPPGFLSQAGMRHADKKAIWSAVDAVGELFSVDEPPRYVLVLGGTVVLLAERAKWAEGRFLAADFDSALERRDTKKAGELETIAALFSADALVPGGLSDADASGPAMFDVLVENSHKHAVGVSKELRNGIRASIELLANEVIIVLDADARAGKRRKFTSGGVDADELTAQCLRYLYRLLVLLYAESRPELGILPVDDEAYMSGYSLDRLRELCLVNLDTDTARNGSHLDESLHRLFELVDEGNHADFAEQQLTFDPPTGDVSDITAANLRASETYLQFPGLHAELFDPASIPYLDEVTFRNETLQQVLRHLMVAEAHKQSEQASFISYAQLGINQLGAVYEGLMAYSGFFADEPLYEVAKPKNGKADPEDGTWVLPISDADGYPHDVFVTAPNPVTGRDERVRHDQGRYVFRLSGRDRQRSASYYTPEVLTQCVVRHALAELLGLDDDATVGGSAGITSASELLELTICEPALGSGAFLNEAINQVAAEYLQRRQRELGEVLDPERYNLELQKVKAHLALHQSYGVDLNATAVELAEVSLWLNATYGPSEPRPSGNTARSSGSTERTPGLRAPWFGLQLRQGNSLIGCRRATWNAADLKAKPWSKTKTDKLAPPVDRQLSEPLADGEIHHFLLPGHGWASVAGRKEAKELRPDEAEALRAWRKTMLASPTPADGARLTQLAAGVEALWAAASERLAYLQRGLARSIDVYGHDRPGESTTAQRLSRQVVEQELNDPDLPLGRLRTLMDAWVGLWFWPVDDAANPDSASPPTWAEWLAVAEELIRPDERHGLTGQLDLFTDREALEAFDERSKQAQTPVAVLRERHPWLAVAVDAARAEGAWHWQLEFAPVFSHGGFDLQVGNPPWVRPRWQDDLVLAELDPWWGVADKPSAAEIRERRAVNLASEHNQQSYLGELASAEGMVEMLGSPVLRPLLAGLQTNLYMVFMDTVWRHLGPGGIAGLLHPESHFTDPKAGHLRRATYAHLRRHWQFRNKLKLFEEVTHQATGDFGLHIYGSSANSHFAHASNLVHPSTLDESLVHDGVGPVPGIQFPEGGWDLRPHRDRVLTIDEQVLADWAKLFDEPGTPAAEARLLRPVTSADLEALSVLASQPTRLADHDYHWTRGHEEDRAKTDGTIRWETEVPGSWDEVVLQGPHFSVATPFAKQPNENCRHNQDYSEWDLESLPERVIPRTNYQRACTPDEYQSRLDHWNGQPSTNHWRLTWRRMTQPGLERSLQCTLMPPGPAHVHTVHSLVGSTTRATTGLSGLWSSLPLDYLVKVSGKADVQDELIRRFPGVLSTSPLVPALLLRTLRLNCLTAEYAPLWEELFDPVWQDDAWTDPALTRLALGDVGPTWTMDTPLRRDQDRRQALVEIDALAALMLGLSAEQLCAMYRTQFAVLRKYEYKMVFDAEGRKICGYHQSAGFRQAQIQDEANAGELRSELNPADWKNVWNRYQAWLEDPALQADPTAGSDYWAGYFTPPFTPADREAEMTRAFERFTERY